MDAHCNATVQSTALPTDMSRAHARSWPWHFYNFLCLIISLNFSIDDSKSQTKSSPKPESSQWPMDVYFHATVHRSTNWAIRRCYTSTAWHAYGFLHLIFEHFTDNMSFIHYSKKDVKTKPLLYRNRTSDRWIPNVTLQSTAPTTELSGDETHGWRGTQIISITYQ